MSDVAEHNRAVGQQDLSILFSLSALRDDCCRYCTSYPECAVGLRPSVKCILADSWCPEYDPVQGRLWPNWSLSERAEEVV